MIVASLSAPLAIKQKTQLSKDSLEESESSPFILVFYSIVDEHLEIITAVTSAYVTTPPLPWGS